MHDPRGDSAADGTSTTRGDTKTDAGSATNGDAAGENSASTTPPPDPVIAIRRILFIGALVPFLGGGAAFGIGWDVERGVVVGLIVAGIVLVLLAVLGVLGVPLHVYRSLRE